MKKELLRGNVAVHSDLKKGSPNGIPIHHTLLYAKTFYKNSFCQNLQLQNDLRTKNRKKRERWDLKQSQNVPPPVPGHWRLEHGGDQRRNESPLCT